MGLAVLRLLRKYQCRGIGFSERAGHAVVNQQAQAVIVSCTSRERMAIHRETTE